jgi:hypothetical protein
MPWLAGFPIRTAAIGRLVVEGMPESASETGHPVLAVDLTVGVLRPRFSEIRNLVGTAKL